MSEDLSGRHVLNSCDIMVQFLDRWYTSLCIGFSDLVAISWQHISCKACASSKLGLPGNTVGHGKILPPALHCLFTAALGRDERC